MFDFFKNFFANKETDNGSPFQPSAPAQTPAAPKPSTAHAPAGFRPRYAQAASPVAPARPPTPTALANTSDANSGSIDLPFGPLLVTLPMELKTRVRPADVSNATFPVPLELVFSQLASGSVKLSFGEIRQAAPQLFTNGSECDQTLVALPLNEILSRVNPSLLVRRPSQKQIEIPEEISSPFGNRGDGLVFTAAPKAPEATPPPRAVTPSAKSAPVQPDVFQQKPAPRPAQPRAFQAPIQPVPPKSAPVPPSAAKPQSETQQFHSTHVPVRSEAPAAPARMRVTPPVPPPAPVEEAISIPASAALRNLGKSIGMATVPPANSPTAQSVRARATTSPAKSAVEVPSLNVPLSSLTESWSEALRLEISESNLTEARVGLPIEPVENAMRRGKVSFPWKTIRSWISPALLPTVSVHDSMVVELPLKVLAPLLMARIRENKGQHKVVVDENIPNLFFGFPQPEAPQPPQKPAVAAPVPAPAQPAQPMSESSVKPGETNYYVWNDTSDAANVDETEFKRKPTIETNFLSRHATPNEVVAGAAALEGVVGALVALPDGLMVASKVPADLNADTLAAFLPQIFGKVSQCTKELRMGDLNNLNFTVGNVPWKIFRVNAIYFAAFGRAGHGLPTAQLATLAAQLDRKKQ